MELKFDTEQFDKCQRILIDEIAQRIKIKLMEAGMEGEKLEDAVAKITFSIASIICSTLIDASGRICCARLHSVSPRSTATVAGRPSPGSGRTARNAGTSDSGS